MGQEVESVFSIIEIPAKWTAYSKDSIGMYSVELLRYRHYFVCVYICITKSKFTIYSKVDR